ncbi:myb-like protein X [Diabrotica virgifera virgifera]|uniref:Protein slender lobes n=1 Tax=Diabrotica virgifera virgifera TaxID=50390 RepID=A0ABM5KZ76_DIAVI|nr:myb-like protein X [Diabrotica virgifera virgifera]XP_050515491.1 myb-like protein X [Diabrotica virgifera virgifera]
MPRPTEIIQAEESTAPRSPLRRSCRIIAVSSPMPSEANTIKESNEDKEVEQTGTANRGKRGSSVTKDNGEASIEPGKTRSRRSSTSSESSLKIEKETVKPIRTRRSSATREEETKKPIRGRRSSIQSDIEEEVAKPVRSTRNSIQNEKEVEEESSVKTIRGRRSSAQDDVNEEQRPARITRSRTSMSRDEETKDAAEPEPRRTTRSRRSSIDAEDDTVPKQVKTPMKPKRRLSVSETAAILEPIDEKEEAQNTAKRKDESVPGSSEIKINTDKTNELYIICENSLGDEDGRKSLTPKASPSLNNEGKSRKGKLEKSELKGSPVIVPEGGRLTPDSQTVRKSPRIQEKIEKCKSGEHTPHKKCTCCDEELSNSPSRRKIGLKTPEENDLTCNVNVEDIQFSTKVIHNDKSIQMKECLVDDDVFTSETVVIQKTETKCLISDGSDGSFQFNLSKSKYETTESEGDLNDSKASDSSDKENAHLNLEKNSKPPITAEQNVLEKLAASAKPERVQNITLNRVSNVFRPKNVDYSFVEAMDVDTTLNLDVSRMEKSHIIPNENSKTIDLTVDETFSLNLSDTYIENSEDTTISKGSKTIENNLEDETNEKENTTLNISKENHENERNTEVKENAQEISSLDVDKSKLKSLKESHKENSVDLKTDSLLNKTDCKDAENREDITENENEVSIEESQIASKESESVTVDSLQNITENHHDVETISNIEDRSTADKAAAEEIEEEDDRFSETDEREESRKSKDCQSIEVKEEEEEDDRFTETKDISEDYEFDVSDTEEVSPVIPTQSESLRNETVKEDILNVSRDEEQSSEIIEREDDPEIDIETLEEDEELSKEIKNNDEATINKNDSDQPTKDSHEKITESAKIFITSDYLEKESVTSSVDDKFACSLRSSDSVSTEENAIQADQEQNIREDQIAITDTCDCKEENNRITEDSVKYDDMENTFQDIVQDDKDEELSATPTNTQDKAEEIESDIIDHQKKETSQSIIMDNKKENGLDATQLIHDQKETISSESTSSSSLSELENEERNELPEKMGMSELLNPIKAQEESNNTQLSVVNSTSLELEPQKSFEISAAISPKKGKKRKSEILTVDLAKISKNITNNQGDTLENNLGNVDKSSKISTVISPKKGKDRQSEIVTEGPAKISEENTNNQENTPENNLENVEIHKSSEISAAISPKKGKQRKSEICTVDPAKISEENANNEEDTPENNLENVETHKLSEISAAISPKKGKNRQSEIVTVDPAKISEENTNIQEDTPENNLENVETHKLPEISAAISPQKGKKRKSEIVTVDPAKISEEKTNNQENTPENNLENVETHILSEISAVVSPKKGKKRKSEIFTVDPAKMSQEKINHQEHTPETHNSSEISTASPKKGKKKKSGIVALEITEEKEKIDVHPALNSKTNEENNAKINKRFSLDHWFESSTVDDPPEPEDIRTKVKDSKNKKKQHDINSDESPKDNKRDTEPTKVVKKNEAGKKLNSTQFLEQYEDPRLDAELERLLKEAEDSKFDGDSSSDEDSSSDGDYEEQSGNSFLDDMAEEGEEDTPSEDSNAIIDEGEPINTDSERSEDEDYDDDSSFICDEGNTELLSGDEFDLGNEQTKKKSRIINVDDRDEEVIKIKRKIKPEPIKRKSRIIKMEDSSDDEEVVDLVSDQEGSVNPTSEESDQASPKKDTIQETVKPKSSIRIIENVDVREIRDTTLSERINQLVDTFCTTIPQTGDVSMNLSLEYAGKASPEEKKKRSKRRKSKDFQRKSISEEENLPKTPKLAEEVSLAESLKNVPTKPRLSLSMTEDDPSTSEQSLKRRLSKSMDDVEKEIKKRKKKKSKKSRQKAESYKKSSADSNSVKDINLDELSFGLINGLLTDVKNRPRRMIKPSTSKRFDLDNNWTVELGVDAKPSTSEISKKETEEFKKPKIHPKDFRTQMLYSSSRVKRIETKQLLKKRAYF